MSAKKKPEIKKKTKRKYSGLMKILESIVIIGSLAAIVMKYFKSKKK